VQPLDIFRSVPTRDRQSCSWPPRVHIIVSAIGSGLKRKTVSWISRRPSRSDEAPLCVFLGRQTSAFRAANLETRRCRPKTEPGFALDGVQTTDFRLEARRNGIPRVGVRRGWCRVGGFNGGVPFWTALLNATPYTVNVSLRTSKGSYGAKPLVPRTFGGVQISRPWRGDQATPLSVPQTFLRWLSPASRGASSSHIPATGTHGCPSRLGPLGHGCVNQSDALQSLARMGISLSLWGNIWHPPEPVSFPHKQERFRIARFPK
jgi:hypothetical protein